MIPLIKNTFFHENLVKRRLCDFIGKSKILSFGKNCEKFEKEFSKWQKRGDFVMVNSGSSANLAVIQALINLKRLKLGDNVGFSAVTWSTNVMPLIQLGLNAIPIDVSLTTLNISPQILVQFLKKQKIKMLFLTNLLGFCDRIDEIQDICRKENIILIEDNCESLGSELDNIKLGNFGLASTFSFYVGHHLSTIEGGGVATDDEELSQMLRIVRAHGWDRNLSFAKQRKIRRQYQINSRFYSRYTFYDLGYNLRPTEINAYAGLVQLPFLDTIISKRQRNFTMLSEALYANEKLFYPIFVNHMSLVSNFAVPLILKSKKARQVLIKKCAKKVEVRPVVGGDMTKQPFFGKYFQSLKYSCPNASLIHNQGFYFGNNPDLAKAELDELISIFKSL